MAKKDDPRPEDEGPKPAFAAGDTVRLTMTRPAEGGTQIPHGALGTVRGSFDAEGSRFEVAFRDVDFPDNQRLTEQARKDMEKRPDVLAHVPVAFLERVEPAPASENGRGRR